MALASTRQLHAQGPASVHAHRTGGVTGSEGQEGANGVAGGIGVGGGNRDGNGDVNGHGDGDGAGTGTGVEVNEGTQDGSGDGAGTGTGTGTGTRRRTPDGNGNEGNIGEGGREAKTRKKPQNSCRRRAENGGDTGGQRRKCRKERVGSVAANPDILESDKKALGEHKVLRAQVGTVEVERVCPLCRACDQRFS